MSGRRVIALLGRQDTPTDAVEDYCAYLGKALERRGYALEPHRVPWAEYGWLGSLQSLSRESVGWRGCWVLVQYTALSWSRRGFPLGLLAVLSVLKNRRALSVIVFHDAEGYSGQRLVDRFRRSCQQWVMRTAYRWADRSVLTVPTEKVSWLPANPKKAVFIPVGANLPDLTSEMTAKAGMERSAKTIAVFGVTGGTQIVPEVREIANAVNRVTQRLPNVRLIVLGRNSNEAKEAFARALNGTKVHLAVLGLLPAAEVSRTLCAADVLLFVRGQVSSRRGSAIAAIACGLPVVGYAGSETEFPVTEAGVVLVPQGDREALAKALERVLTEEEFGQQLRERSLHAQRKYFSWDAIAGRYLGAIGHA